VSCGAREDSSSLAGHRGNPNKHDKHNNDRYDRTNDGASAQQDGRFPHAPHKDMTPGSLCERSSTTRYPEHVKYCDRDVDGETKRQIFVAYDREFGYETTKMNRSSFKIDHLIPLCLGGSNDVSNLWPQHVTIYENTDPLEPFLCDVLSRGRIKQAEAVQLILTIKQSPFTAPEELRKLEERF
jgi:hypothetical protein